MTSDLIRRIREYAAAHEYVANADQEQNQLMHDLYEAADTIERQATIMRGCLNTLRIVREYLGLPPESKDGGDDLLQALSARRNVVLCPRPINTAKCDSEAWCVISGNCGCDALLGRLARFAAYVIREWHNNGERGSVDGGELQDAAEIYGIVYKDEVPAGGCCDACTCVANGADEGDFCYPLKEDVFDFVYGDNDGDV